MNARIIRFSILLAFALASGHAAYRTWGPPAPPEYWLKTRSPALASSGEAGQPPDKVLYLRHVLRLTRQPQQAWISVIGRDRINVFVNGNVFDAIGPNHSGALAGRMIDISPLLREGENMIAIKAAQTTVEQPPLIAVDGGYVLEDRQWRPIGTGVGVWKMHTRPVRHNTDWQTAAYDDSDWQVALPGETNRALGKSTWLKAPVATPPDAVARLSDAHWIAPLESGDRAVRGEVEVDFAPASGWLRVAVASPFRLAFNGQVVLENIKQLGTSEPYNTIHRMFDVTPAAEAGQERGEPDVA